MAGKGADRVGIRYIQTEGRYVARCLLLGFSKASFIYIGSNDVRFIGCGLKGELTTDARPSPGDNDCGVLKKFLGRCKGWVIDDEAVKKIVVSCERYRIAAPSSTRTLTES